MAQFVGQITKLNENVRLLLSDRDPESEEDGETASVEAVERVDMEASLSAILDSKTTDKVATTTGDAFLQELAQDLSVKEQTSPSIHEGLTGIFNGLLSEKMPDDKIKAKLDKYTQPENIKGLRTPKVNPLIWNQLSILAKDISEANKLTKKVRPPHSTNSRGDKYGGRSSYGSSQGNRRFHPYSKGKPDDFLGKSRFFKQRKKKDGETSQCI